MPRYKSNTPSWIALQGTLVVMPVFVLALTNPSFSLVRGNELYEAVYHSAVNF